MSQNLKEGSSFEPKGETVSSVNPTFPLTPRQMLVWIENLTHPGIPLNTVTTLFEVNGRINPDKFAQAFSRLVDRHEALRATLEVEHGVPGFRISNEGDKSLEVVDLTDADNREEALQSWLRIRCAKLFEDGARLYDPALIKLEADRFVFYLNRHHIISDNWSSVVLHKDLEALYLEPQSDSRFSAERLNHAESKAYSAYLTQTAEYPGSKKAVESEAYWIERFSHKVPPVRFYGRSTSHKRALMARVSRRLDADMSRRIWELQPRISPSLVFTTAVFAYLRRVTVSEDLCIGVPLHNRTTDLAETVGLLMEVCPNRVHVGRNHTFKFLLDKIQQEIVDVRPFRHHSVSVRTAGYEVMLNYVGAVPGSFAGFPATYDHTSPLLVLDQLAGGDEPSDQWVGRESLSILIQHAENQQEFEIHFDFNRGVFPDAEERERAVDHFLKILEAFLEDLNQEIETVDLLTSYERAVLFPSTDKSRAQVERLPSVVEMFAEQAERRPDHPAIVFENETITYRELDRRVRLLGRHLRQAGVDPDGLVGVCVDRSPNMVVALLATMRAGGAYVPIDPRHPAGRIDLILEDADPPVILSEEGFRQKLGADRQDRVICLDGIDWRENEPLLGVEEFVRSDLAYIVFTSGSTGRPKGVRAHHQGLSSYLSAMKNEPGLGENDRVLAATTISFDPHTLELFLPLITGATICIVPYNTTIDGEALARLMDEQDITLVQATPATFRMLIASGWTGKSDLKVLCGAEPMPRELADALLGRASSVWNLYGPTEATVWTTVKKVTPGTGPVSIGRPISGAQVYVLNESCKPVPIGVPGEFYIAGNGVADGYHGREDLTREQFVPDHFSKRHGACVYRTGDIGRMRNDLDLEFIGRADFQVKIRGFRVELEEIESVIAAQESVHECAAGTFTDALGERALVAYIVPEQPGVAFNRDRIISFLRHRLPTYMIPSKIIIMEELPRSPTGKIDRQALPKPETGREISHPRDYVAPRDDMESSLIAVWGEVLGVDSLGISDDFFELGGHSIMAAALVQRMKANAGFEIDLGSIFSAPTIKQLVELKQSEQTNPNFVVVPLQSKGGGLPLFLLHGIDWFRELAASLGEDQPILGIYVKQNQEILERVLVGEPVEFIIDELADGYREAIQSHQPHGPYRLAGHSFGGFLAIEVACKLQALGEDVEVVFLLDTLLHGSLRRVWSRYLLLTARKIWRGELLNMLKRRVGRIAQRLSEKNDNSDYDRLRKLNGAAVRSYRGPTMPLHCKIVLFDAANRETYGGSVKRDPDYSWERIFGSNLEIHPTPGDHVTVIQAPHVDALTKIMRSYLS